MSKQDDRRLTRDKLLRFAKRLRAGDPISTEDRQVLAGEMERIAATMRGPGRPKSPPLERALRKFNRRSVADAIYDGILPETFYGPTFALSVKQAKGKRTEADAVAAAILGKGHSVRLIQQTRAVHPITRDEWEEWKALLVFSASKPS
jgi:hypothetical protein